jgi:hypothetical protein
MPQNEKPTSPSGETPFQRFEDFARRIFAVPKKELDEKLAEQKHLTDKQGKKRNGKLTAKPTPRK